MLALIKIRYPQIEKFENLYNNLKHGHCLALVSKIGRKYAQKTYTYCR